MIYLAYLLYFVIFTYYYIIRLIIVPRHVLVPHPWHENAAVMKYTDAQVEMQIQREPNLWQQEKEPIYECPKGHPYWLNNCSRPWVLYC